MVRSPHSRYKHRQTHHNTVPIHTYGGLQWEEIQLFNSLDLFQNLLYLTENGIAAVIYFAALPFVLDMSI